MNLYVITKPDELVGKTIAYADITHYWNTHVLVTTDGGVFIWSTENDGDGDILIDIFSQPMVETHIFCNKTIMKKLITNGAFTQAEVDAFLSHQIEQRRKDRLRREQHQEKLDREAYERLKKKFGDDSHAGL
jgi:hypothetical protein